MFTYLLLLSVLRYFTYTFCHLLDFSYVYYLLELFIYLFIYLFTYLYFSLFFIFALCGLGLYKVFLEVVSPRMILHCKYLAILVLLVYTEI